MSLTRLRYGMKRLLWVIWAFAAIFILGIFLSFNFGGDVATAQGGSLFARVDGQNITTGEFDFQLRETRDQYRQFAQMTGQPMTSQMEAELPGYAWESMLREYTDATAAKASGINVSPAEARRAVAQEVDARLAQFAEGATKEEMAEARSLMLANRNVDSDRRKVMSQRLRDKVAEEARPVEVRVAHVLIKTEERPVADALKQAQEVSRQARAGTDFSALVAEHSEDVGSKEKDGVVGWASAQPSVGPSPESAAAENQREPAASFVPEFTSAALRLRPGQVSDPVRSTFGFHVIKALEERPFEPTGEEAKTDPTKRESEIETYRTAAANQISEGIFSEYHTRAVVEPVAPWLRGYMLEKELASLPPSGEDAPSEAERLGPVIEAYSEALEARGPEAGAGLAYKLASLHKRADQHEQALAVLEEWAPRSRDAEMHFAHGETLEKLDRKSDALAAYEEALKAGSRNPAMLTRLDEKFQELGRADLAEKARDQQNAHLTRMAEEQARQQAQQEELQRQIQEQLAAQGDGEDAPAPVEAP
jgi:parvulin-like peptidyl-prolyl isomerase